MRISRAVVKAGLALAGAACLAAAACAQELKVIEADVRVSFASSTISGFEKLDQDTYLLRVGANRFYRAQLNPNCGSGALDFQTIGVETGPFGELDRFSTLVLDGGRRCSIQQLDRVEKVKGEQG